MELKQPYKNLNNSLKYFRVQVIDSLPYAYQCCPKMDSPQQIFNWLKLRTKYKNDPKKGQVINGEKIKEDTELFQALPTLLENNFHGITGAGDCDCFTIAALALLQANGFQNCGIVLVGRNPIIPVHIYAYVDDNGSRKYLDLTNRYFDYERYYPYKQSIPLVLTKNDLQNMTLQLAEGPKTRRRRRVHSMPHRDYIYLPNAGVQVAEDYLDEYHINDFTTLLSENGYNVYEISELAAKRSQRASSGGVSKRQQNKTAKKAEKEARKATTARGQKKAAKIENKKAKAELKRAKADKKRMKGEASVNKSTKEKRFKLFKGGDGEEGGEESNVDKAVKIFDTVGNVVGKFRGKGGNAPEETEQTTAVTAPVTPSYQPTAGRTYTQQPDTEAEDSEEVATKKAKKEALEKFEKEKKETEAKIKADKNFNIFGTDIPKPVVYVGAIALGAIGLKYSGILKR